jgi:hypothetical protein
VAPWFEAGNPSGRSEAARDTVNTCAFHDDIFVNDSLMKKEEL